jgi:hypothetical protein
VKTTHIASMFLLMSAAVGASSAQAATIALWTFETSAPVTAGPFAAEVGVGQALGFHAGASTYSSPAGNGSARSFSSTGWAVGDYYQFSVSTTGFTGLSLSCDQTSSNTGPRDFTLAYSTNGTSFTNLLDYSVLANAAPNPTWNGTTSSPLYSFSLGLSGALDGQAQLIFRLLDRSTVSANGGVVASGGTDRLDNFLVAGTATTEVPVPAAAWLLGSGLLGMLGMGRRRRATG